MSFWLPLISLLFNNKTSRKYYLYSLSWLSSLWLPSPPFHQKLFKIISNLRVAIPTDVSICIFLTHHRNRLSRPCNTVLALLSWHHPLPLPLDLLFDLTSNLLLVKVWSRRPAALIASGSLLDLQTQTPNLLDQTLQLTWSPDNSWDMKVLESLLYMLVCPQSPVLHFPPW